MSAIGLAGKALKELITETTPAQRKLLFAAWDGISDRGLFKTANAARNKALKLISGESESSAITAARNIAQDIAETATGRSIKSMPEDLVYRNRAMQRQLGMLEDPNYIVHPSEILNKGPQRGGQYSIGGSARNISTDPYKSPYAYIEPAYKLEDVLAETLPGLAADSTLPILDKKLLTEPLRMLDLYKRQSKAVQKVLDSIIKRNGILTPTDFLAARRIAQG